MNKEIIITFKADGTTRVEAHGFVGQSCTSATSVFEQKLGLSQDERELKPEFFQQEEQQQGNML